MRGICALVILCFHTFFHETPNPFAHGYLSVDVFFILSGFVLAFAFGDKLDAGMPPKRFILERIRRLAPVLLIGSLLTAASVAVADWLVGGPGNYGTLVLDTLRNIFLIPHVGHSGLDAFPLNPPTWSLFAEFWVNVLFAIFATRLDRKALAVVIALGWLFIAIHSAVTGSADFGDSQASIDGAILRAMPSFAVGVLLFKLWREGDLKRLPAIHPIFIFAAWVVISMVPLGRGQAIFDVAQIVVIAPLLIALAARYEGATPRWAIWLGRVSYPLYATHSAVVNLGQRISVYRTGHVSLLTEAIVFAVSLLAAWAIAEWYEPIVIAFLRRRTPPQLATQA